MEQTKSRLRVFLSFFLWCVLLPGGLWGTSPACAQTAAGELQLHIVSSQTTKHHATPAVVWLQPLPGTPVLPFSPAGPYTLLQKNRTFLPHLQVVPVGSAVAFPNADPFFHNVFSLFDGKRFDLGLYEAGSSKSVTFSREGVSYIFCNIHPEMSAVILSLSTPTYGVADTNGSIVVHNIPPGDYRMQVWVEGVSPFVLQGLGRKIHVAAGVNDLGEVKVAVAATGLAHENKFGTAYPKEQTPAY